MTTQRDADRILRAWLDLMPDEAPDRTVAAVLQAVETTPQSRRPIVFGPRRSTSMTRFALIAAAAALGVAMLGGALLVGGRPSTVAPTPAPVATPPPSTASSPSTAPSPTAALTPAPEALRGNWLSDAADHTIFGEVSGYVRLVVPANGASAWLLAPGGNEAGRSTVQAVAPDILELSLNRDRPDCAAGTIGRYRWSVADDRLQLTLDPIEDACPARAEALGRLWTRTHVGASNGGTAVVQGVGPLVQVTLPVGSYTTEAFPDAVTIGQPVPEFQFLAFKDPQGFLDPCDIAAGRREIAPGTDAIVDYFRQLEGFTVDSVSELEVDGYRAVRLDVRANGDAPCDRLAEWQPKADTTDQHWLLSPGDTDSLVIVALADATMMFEVLPAQHVEEDAVIGSIRFLDGLPTSP